MSANRKNRIVIKIIASICFILMIYSIGMEFMGSITYADGLSSGFNGTISGDTGNAKDKIRQIIGGILRIVRDVGVTVAVGMLLIVATKYIIASAGERADIKKAAVAYVIGALVLFGASGIAQILQNFIIKSLE